MNRSLRALFCLIILLAFVGTVSGAGCIVAGKTGFADCTGGMAKAGGSMGALETTTIRQADGGCYFPIINLPAYYVCIMVCKIDGGGDACPAGCERALSVCN